MTQQEFETRTGLTVTTNEYAYIQRVYMASNFQKDEFCKEWKKNNSLATSNLVCDLVMEIETLRGSYETLQKEYTRACDGAKAEVSSMADFLILQAEKWSASDLREKAIKMVGIKEYIRRRLNFGFGLWEEDKKALTEILTAE